MKQVKLIFIALLLPSFAIFSQSIVSMNPSSASAGQTLDVIITGSNTNFDPNETTLVFEIYNLEKFKIINILNSMSVLSPTSLKANITVPANAESGDFQIYVHISDSAGTDNFPFHINGAPPLPIISVENLQNIVVQKTMDLTISGHRRPYGTGTHFNDPNSTAATKVTFDTVVNPNFLMIVNSTTILDDSTIIVNVTTPPQAMRS